ncbi:MAG TPA: SDR family NAD(P)-dependent oxidoreductase [Acidimicrobiales bacterium]|jgi:NAD(P)-dependent dehydrogenase (short-subunit alcohol dehydrogenase family)|nr:SDR family NAD(P)-dependent oxidoreductase [Acidimicrobiales bacterium]
MEEARLVAVVTGASRGLGAGMAAAWATRGIRVALCARTRPDAPERADSLTASVDVTDAVSVDGFAGDVVERFGPIDLWVNNAGILDPVGPLADADPGALSRNVDVNVLGVLNGSSAFARHVRARAGRGVLVNISSGGASRPYAGWAAYCGSKAAVEMITEVVAVEEREHGLRAHALAPGLVDTDMQALIRATPIERFPDVERFHEVHRRGSFNSAAWVAAFILEQLVRGPDAEFGADSGPAVRLRVPDEY